MLLRLALRNLVRQRRRSAITAAAIALGMMLVILTVTLQEGTYRQMIRTGVGSMAGHVVVQGAGYQLEQDPEIMVDQSTEAVEALRGAFPEAVVLRRISTGGLLMSAGNSAAVGLQGTEPELAIQVHDLHEKLQVGQWVETGEDRGLVIGSALADSLEVEVGDKLVFMGQADGEMVSRMFRVRGLFHTGSAELDGFVAMSTLAAAQEVLERPDGATQVSLHLTDPHQAAQALLTARQVLSQSGLEILPWQEVLPQLDNFVKVDRKMGGILLGVIGFIVALGVFNTILVSVLERTREFGVLMAVGLRPRKLAALIMTEGLLLGIGGMILGIGLGALAAWPLIELGLDLSESMGGETIETAGVVSSTHIFGAWYWPRVLQYSAIGVVFSLCAAFLPARQVARLQPVDAMRHH